MAKALVKAGFSEAQKALITKTTPKKYLKTRQGRGGLTLTYVETGYVIDQLNQLFNYLWDFEVLEHGINENQIWVKGKLTAKIAPDLIVSKTQYGGTQIKKFQDGKVIDIADDLKAAASDALKKCASLLGIASDVYWQGNGEEEVEATTANSKACQYCGTTGKYHKLGCPSQKG